MSQDFSKTLINLSNNIYNNSETIAIEPSSSWNKDFFKKKWFTDTKNQSKYISRSPGWYWIGCNMSLQNLTKLELLPGKILPTNACNVKELANVNYNTFGEDYLCKVESGDFRIIYNGHQGSIITRIRQHFTLDNHSTGALGLWHYPIYEKKWIIRYFGRPHIDSLPIETQNDVKSLINSKSGRIAIESAWRSKNGWPILCKA